MCAIHLHEPYIPLKNSRPRCYTKSPTAQDVFWPIPTLVSCAAVTRRWRLLSYAQNAVRYVADTHLLVRKSMKPGAAWRGSAYPGIINRRLFTNGRSREICSENEHYYIYIQCMYLIRTIPWRWCKSQVWVHMYYLMHIYIKYAMGPVKGAPSHPGCS